MIEDILFKARQLQTLNSQFRGEVDKLIETQRFFQGYPFGNAQEKFNEMFWHEIKKLDAFSNVVDLYAAGILNNYECSMTCVYAPPDPIHLKHDSII